MRFVIRVWLPDKPGALGRVASAIGSVGASLVGIEILEEDGGFAIDELIVDAIESENASDKLVVALTFIEGVSVESIRRTTQDSIDARLEVLETMSQLVQQDSVASLGKTLVDKSRENFGADWSALISLVPADTQHFASGDAPSAGWLRAFVEGSRSSQAVVDGVSGPDDTAWAELIDSKCALVIGREGRPLRARERSQLHGLVRVVDNLMSRLDS